MKVTALLGAGAVLEIGGSSTDYLTELVMKHKTVLCGTSSMGKVEELFIFNIANELNSLWKSEKCNFEDILDALEKLYSYRLYGSDPKKFKPTFGAFIAPKNEDYFNRKFLEQSIHDFITIIGDAVELYDNAFQPNIKDKWFASFWKDAAMNCKLDIATLNYDTCIEKSTNTFEDGFEDVGKCYYKFNIEKLREASLPRVLHPHGCIYYGYPQAKHNSTYYYNNDNQELYKFINYYEAKQSWSRRPIHTKQSHEKAMIGPIITGLGKTDKLIYTPYLEYYHEFYESLLTSNGLLIAGYSFGDDHFNKMLERLTYLPNNKKIVIITYCDKSDFSWNIKSSLKKHTKMEEFILKAIKKDLPLKNPLDSPAESEDGNLRIYFGGMKDAIEGYGKNIIDFLTS